MRKPRFLWAALVVGAVASVLYAWGGNHPKGEMHLQKDTWPTDMLKLLNIEQQVHGHWVNANDEFFYKGDLKALNAFIKTAASMDDVIPVYLDLRAGDKRRSDLWGDKPDIKYNWKMLVLTRGWAGPMWPKDAGEDVQLAVVIDVWLDRGIVLEKLEVPVNVVVRSGGDIEKFIASHEKVRKAAMGEAKEAD